MSKLTDFSEKEAKDFPGHFRIDSIRVLTGT
jgi:hypothetical protein